jgi:elongation factor Ts
MAITIDDIKNLRNRTCCGISDCKKALIEADGDFEKAVDILRKKGLKVAASRSGMTTAEGVAISAVNSEKNFGAVILLACETDFVSSNAMFVEVASKIVNAAVANKVKTVEDLKKVVIDNLSVEEHIVELMSKVTENISLAGFEFLESAVVVDYTHFNKKIAVLVGLDNVALSEEIASTGKSLAMQIAAYNPVAISRDRVAQDIIDRETEIAREQSAGAKNEEIAQKMVQGKLEKFFKENVLLEQLSMVDEKMQVRDYLKKVDPNMVIKDFKRISVG